MPYTTNVNRPTLFLSRGSELLSVTLCRFTDDTENDEGVGPELFISSSSLESFINFGNLTTIFQAEVFAIETCAKQQLVWKQ